MHVNRHDDGIYSQTMAQLYWSLNRVMGLPGKPFLSIHVYLWCPSQQYTEPACGKFVMHGHGGAVQNAMKKKNLCPVNHTTQYSQIIVLPIYDGRIHVSQYCPGKKENLGLTNCGVATCN